VLHVSLDQTVSHVRAYYDTVFEDLAHTTGLQDEAQTHAEIDRLRSIRAYSAERFSPAKLREAVELESGGEGKPELIVVEGCDLAAASREDVEAYNELARTLHAELWFSTAISGETVAEIPAGLNDKLDSVQVILALEPQADTVGLRCLKDHENPDPSALRVHLDPKTLFLARG